MIFPDLPQWRFSHDSEFRREGKPKGPGFSGFFCGVLCVGPQKKPPSAEGGLDPWRGASGLV